MSNNNYLHSDEKELWYGKPFPHLVFNLSTVPFTIFGIVLFFALGGYRCFMPSFWTQFELWNVLVLLPGMFFILMPLRFKFALYFTKYVMTTKRFVIIENYFIFKRVYSLNFENVNYITIYPKKSCVVFDLGSYERWWNTGPHNVSAFEFHIRRQDFENFLFFLPKEKLFHFSKVKGLEYDLIQWESSEYVGIYAPELLKGVPKEIIKDPAFTSGGSFGLPGGS